MRVNGRLDITRTFINPRLEFELCAWNESTVWASPAHLAMMAHQALRMDLEVLAVHVINVDVFAAIPTAHHVLHRTWIFHPQLARHESIPKAIWPRSATPKGKSANHAMG